MTLFRSLGIVLLLTLVVWGLVHIDPPYEGSKMRPVVTEENSNLLKYAADFQTDMQTVGVEAAYEKLRMKASSLTDSEQHLMGHAFGRALFAEKGKEGLLICGLAFGGGCMHEFTGIAIENEGIGVVNELNELCTSKLTPVGAITCQHGFGHGLISYLGYTSKDLNAALTVCKDIDSGDAIKGCYGGAFMEFDSRYMAGNKLRDYTPEAPFGLCEKLDPSFRGACAFWETQWILDSLYKDHQNGAALESFKSVGALCETLRPEVAQYCFQGLGYFAPPSASFDPILARKICNVVSSEERYQTECWEEAAKAVH